MEAPIAAEAAYIVQAWVMVVVVVCSEILPVQGLDLSRQVLMTQEAVCSHQAE